LRSSLGSRRVAEEAAVRLIERDYEEEDRKAGQRVGQTFPLADFFLTSEPKASVDKQLTRLIQLTFGNPYISPTRDEQSMFFAQAAALRSLDLSRQVGAAIVDSDGAIISTGCNEVPKFGGGLYWGEDPHPARDHELGYDANAQIKAEIAEDMIGRLRANGWLATDLGAVPAKELAQRCLGGDAPFLRSSQMYDVIEFGRAVHAEAAAITEAARRGVGIRGGRLFCTTFPCHICARHIVASGIQDVVFIEPYEKSRTSELYTDSVSIEPQERSGSRVNFQAFVGVAPRRYLDFFQSLGPRKNPDGKTLETDQISAKPRIKRIVSAYLLVEELVIRNTAPMPELRQRGEGR
jgi:deoxycytidylate deaminase